MKTVIDFSSVQLEDFEPTGDLRCPKKGECFLSVDGTVNREGYPCGYPRIILRKKRWRANHGGKYYSLSPSLETQYRTDVRCRWAEKHYKVGNYFQTKEQAEAAAKEVSKVLLHG